MATYPPVTDAERDAAIARIARRHRLREDTRWSEAGSEARDVLAYLRRRHVRLPYALAADDVWDELVLSAWVYWDERRRERELLHRARRYGLSLSELGHFLGIGTRQGTRDYLDRLDALLAEHAGHTRTAHLSPSDPGANGDHNNYRGPRAPGISISFAGRTRAERGADVHSVRERRAARRARPAHETWISQQAPRIAASITTLLNQAARAGFTPAHSEDDTAGIGDYLAWLAQSLGPSHAKTENNTEPYAEGGAEVDPGAGQRFTPATIATIGLVLGELRDRPEVTALPRNHGLRLAIAAADRLRADFAELKIEPVSDDQSGKGLFDGS
jgi:hypothetical protein